MKDITVAALLIASAVFLAAVSTWLGAQEGGTITNATLDFSSR